MRRLTPTLLVLIGVLLSGAPANAVPGAPTDCVIVDRSLVCGQEVVTPGSPRSRPAQPASASRTRGRPTAVWTREAFNRRSEAGDANTLGAETCTTPDGQPGTRYRDTLLSETGEVLNTVVRCVGERQPAATAPAPPPIPPQPPTREELIASSPIPQPMINRNPSSRGLTGLESRFWASGGTTVEASVSLRGWTVTGTLGAGTLTWDTGDGGHYQTRSPGTASAPAVRHTYERRGIWPVSLSVAWAGSYTVTGYGTSYTVDGLSTSGTTSLDYEVIEIRSVLEDGGRT